MSIDPKDLYAEAGTIFRYYVGWRNKIFAGYLATLVALALAFAWTQDESKGKTSVEEALGKQDAINTLLPSSTLDRLEVGLDSLAMDFKSSRRSVRSRTSVKPTVENTLPIAGIVVSLLFWLIDFRNRDIWKTCQYTAIRLEQSQGVYSDLDKVKPFLSHGIIIDAFIALVISALVGYYCSSSYPTIPTIYIVIGIVLLTICLTFLAKYLDNKAQHKREAALKNNGPNTASESRRRKKQK